VEGELPPETTPLGGNELILKPPAPYRSTAPQRKLYTLRPRIDGSEIALTEADRADLDRIVAEVRALADLRIEVTGHTDNAELPQEARQRYADEVELSEAWARAVADYLAERLEISPGGMASAGRGGDEPVALIASRRPSTDRPT
jgi:outer membrane protein OmpA-like peptidoglycan-associated protein